MFRTCRSACGLLDRRRRRLFAALGSFALGVSALEALSAVLVLVLLELVVEPSGVPAVPIIGDLTDVFPHVSRQKLVIGFGIVFVVFFTLRAITHLGQQYASARVIQNTGVAVSHRLFSGYLLAPYEFHLRRNSAESLRNVNENVQQLVSGVLTPLMNLFAETVMVLFMLAVLMATEPLVTMMAAAMMGAAVTFSLVIVQPRLKHFGRERQLATRAAIQHVQQGLHGLRDVKVSGRENSFSGVYRNARARMARAEYLRTVLSHVPRATVETTFLLFIVALLLLSESSRSLNGLLSTLGLFAYAGLRLQPSLQKIANSLNSIRYAGPAVDELLEDFGRVEPHIRAHDAARGNGSTALPFERALELHDVSFTYADAPRPALAHVTVRVTPGLSVGIAGPTGGGKSTLLDIVCGLLTPTSGRVTVDGVDIATHTRAWQRCIGVVHQSSFLVDDTVRRNIALGVPEGEIDDELLAEIVHAAELEPVVAQLDRGVDTPVGERGVRLSGGQRQRIALARALYRQPRLLILDEATSALDNATEARILANIARLSPTMAVIAVAHRMRTIQSADVVLLLSDGHLVGSGTYDELVTSNTEFAALSG